MSQAPPWTASALWTWRGPVPATTATGERVQEAAASHPCRGCALSARAITGAIPGVRHDQGQLVGDGVRGLVRGRGEPREREPSAVSGGAGANPGNQPVSAAGAKLEPEAPLVSSRPSTARAFPSQLTRFPHEKAQEAGYAAGAPPMGSVPDCAPRVRRTGKSATSSRSTKWSCSSTKRQPCP